VYTYNTLDGSFYEVKAGSTYYQAVLDQTTGIATADIGSATSISFAQSNNAQATVITSVTVSAATASAANMSAVNTALGGANSLMQNTKTGEYFIKNVVDGVTNYYKANLGSIASGSGQINVITSSDYRVVVDPLAAIDSALADVDSLRSDLGAMQNRFESTITNLDNTTNNLSASRSRIEDADYATEVSNMTKAQILQQAGTSVLAQANQVPQTVLSLLR
jgi:flagellin